MYFTLYRRVHQPPATTANNNVLQYVDDIKLLGCRISFNLKWNTHIDYVLAQMSKI